MGRVFAIGLDELDAFILEPPQRIKEDRSAQEVAGFENVAVAMGGLRFCSQT